MAADGHDGGPGGGSRPSVSRVIPGKRRPSEQVSLELDQRNIGERLDIDLEDLNISPGDLFTQAIQQTRMALCVSDPHQPDAPIVFANQAFTELTGYPRDEIVGRNCRFLQGPDTDPAAVERMRKAIREEEVVVVDILNYRKDGTPFWNAVHIGPIFDRDGKLAYLYGSQWDVSEVVNQREEAIRQRQVAAELKHRNNNLFAVLGSIVRLSARGEDDVQSVVAKTEDRIGALARAHKVSLGDYGTDSFDRELRSFVGDLIEPYQVEGRERIALEGDPVRLRDNVFTSLGLTLHELATNAVKYGALSNADGQVTIRWEQEGDMLELDWIERGGPPVESMADDAPRGSGTGMRIVTGMLRGIGGEIALDYAAEGLSAKVRLPLTIQ